MSEIISKDSFLNKKDFYIEEIKKGKIFIYPTDTLLGIGCNAILDEKVQEIKEIKERRDDKPCSIVVPNFRWIEEACDVSKENFEFMQSKLPGAYTFVLKVKDKSMFSTKINTGFETIGIRIPKHWFVDIIREAKVPFVTTSVNKAGNESAVSISDIDEDIREKVDYIISDSQSLSGKPSTIIDLTKEQPEIIERNPTKED